MTQVCDDWDLSLLYQNNTDFTAIYDVHADAATKTSI